MQQPVKRLQSQMSAADMLQGREDLCLADFRHSLLAVRLQLPLAEAYIHTQAAAACIAAPRSGQCLRH